MPTTRRGAAPARGPRVRDALGALWVAGGVPADEGEVGGVAVLRIGDVSRAARRPLRMRATRPRGRGFSGDGVVVFGGGVPCLSLRPCLETAAVMTRPLRVMERLPGRLAKSRRWQPGSSGA